MVLTMKRDPDLIRTILLAVENALSEYVTWPELREAVLETEPPRNPPWEEAQLSEHVRLLVEEKLIEAQFDPYYGETGRSTQIRLTSDGHKSIAKARNGRVWQAVKAKSGDFSFAALKGMFIEAAKKLIGFMG